MNNAYSRFRARGDGRPLRPRVPRPRFHISPATKRMIVTALVIVAVFVLLYFTASFWLNWLWFGSMGYRSVLIKRYVAQVIIFLVFGTAGAAIFVLNVSLALRQTREGAPREGFLGRLSQRAVTALAVGGGAVIFLIGGIHAASRWETFLLFWYGGSFGVKDPTFHRDAGFYVFTLPVLHGIQFGLLAIVILTFIAVALVYALRLGVRFRHWGDVPWTAVRHLSGLGSALLLLFAFGYVLKTWMLVYSNRGFVFGPGFTDTNIVQPLNWLMVALSVLAALGLLSGFILKKPKWLAALVGGWIVLAFILTPLLPALVEKTIVQPNEFKREETYINRNIAMTRAGFGLDGAKVVDLTGTQPIDATQLSTGEPPLRNARIWDYRVAAPIYQQLQSFVPYYQFGDVDVDRYTINGQPTQVLVSARELNLDGLPANARTWTNTHLAYTHGYGLVVSPVSDVSKNGWPTFLASEIPVKTVPELKVTQPQLYFTETPTDWIIVHTKQPEFGGIDNSEVDSYTGAAKGSIGLGNPFSRALAAISLKDQKVFLSGQITGQSRLIQTRSVVDRAKRIAPFLTYDPDPYLVVANGKLYWIIDAYSTTDAFPQATRYDGINYLRNGVKVVVDAYDGTTTFYRTDEPDPIADAYGRIYKHLFTPVAEAPPAIAAHFRYPELQFNLQSAVYADYHVDNARTYYDGDDRWSVAEEEVGGKVQPMEPYFVTQTLPGKEKSTFSLTVPFTPGGGQSRQNMTAWFAGSADATGKTDLTLYRYPRSTTVFGPRQIEARIDQTPDISAQITLWGQSGSQVIRGNLLVIPVGDAMLYVQPLYLQAAGSSAAAPQLARVILVTNDRIVMRSTLPDAIRALQDPNASTAGTIEGAPAAQQQPAQQPSQPAQQPSQPTTNQPASQGAQPAAPADLAGMSPAQLAHEALTVYDQGQTALQRGDWAAYGQAQQRLQQILTLMAGAPAATPVPAATPNG